MKSEYEYKVVSPREVFKSGVRGMKLPERVQAFLDHHANQGWDLFQMSDGVVILRRKRSLR